MTNLPFEIKSNKIEKPFLVIQYKWDKLMETPVMEPEGLKSSFGNSVRKQPTYT